MSISWNSDILDSLKCSLCKNYLSIPPIATISNDGQKQKCGRCKEIKTEIDIRNILYEKMAVQTEYPCIYTNCEKKLRWGEVESHEDVCLYKSIKCPIWMNCDETIEISDLEEHFMDKHYNQIQHDIYKEKSPTRSTSNCTLLSVDDKTYLITRYLRKKTLWYQVCALKWNENYEYEVRIHSNSSDHFSLLYKNVTVSFRENEHCYRCFSTKCQEKGHKNSYDANPPISDTAMKIDLEIVKSALKSDVYDCTIVIKTTSIPERFDNLTISKQFTSINNTTLIQRILECPVCEENMSAPIYTCTTGHSLCSNCKSRLNNCPTCKSSLGASRNFALEDLAENAELSCQNESCNFFGNVEVLERHLIDCDESVYDDPSDWQ